MSVAGLRPPATTGCARGSTARWAASSERSSATGLTETTRVVYTSDHGDNIGARGMWGKSTHYDDAVGVPMIVAGPDVARGRVCHTPVSLVDLAPTIMDAVGEDPVRLGERTCRDGRCSRSAVRPTIPRAPSSPNTTRSPRPPRPSC